MTTNDTLLRLEKNSSREILQSTMLRLPLRLRNCKENVEESKSCTHKWNLLNRG